MIYSDIIGKVSSELNLPAKLVDRTYRAFWLFINQSIQSLPLKEDIDEEDFAKLKTFKAITGLTPSQYRNNLG